MVVADGSTPPVDVAQVEQPPVHPFGVSEVAQHSDALARERENYWADEVA